MRALRTYPIRLQKIQEDNEKIIIDLLIDGKLKHILVDTGAHDDLILFEPASKPGRIETKPGLMMDYSGTTINVNMQIGSIATTQEALFLDKKLINHEYISTFIKDEISGFIGFHCLLPYFNTISYQDKQLQFIPEAELTRQRIFFLERVPPVIPSLKTSFTYIFEDEVFTIDTGSPITLEMVSPKVVMSKQDVVVKLPSSPLKFTFSGVKFPTKTIKQNLPIRVFLLGMDFMKRVGSLSFTSDKIYINNIRYQDKNLACRLENIEVYKNTHFYIKEHRFPLTPGSKAVYALGPLLPELVIENPD